jgi:acyl-CoA synthetase (AMP-forming)/AMP-acid ligase II
VKTGVSDENIEGEMMMRYLLFHGVEHSAEKHPEKESVRFLGKSLSYGELSQRSTKLARLLIEQGLQRGDRVGIFMNKGLESAVAMYGIMKAGGAYIPLDPFAPESRVGFVIQDCGIRHLITSPAKVNSLNAIFAGGTPLEHLIGVDSDSGLPAECVGWEDVYRLDDTPLSLNLTEQDLAYILYTSGSTGVPKGIMHTHRSGLSFAEWGVETYGLSPDDHLSNHAPLHFDL